MSGTFDPKKTHAHLALRRHEREQRRALSLSLSFSLATTKLWGVRPGSSVVLSSVCIDIYTHIDVDIDSDIDIDINILTDIYMYIDSPT